jgi:hypothetical protein
VWEHLVSDANLTPMQRQVLHWFFELPESEGFVLAGGAALLALGLSSRPTQDIDLFSSDLEVGVRGAADELAARKLLALFDRAEARDFVDMHSLSSLMDLDHLLPITARLDPGFDRGVLAEALATHTRFTNDDFRA